MRTEPLARYWDKRDFSLTAEPRGQHVPKAQGWAFVVQKHAASHLHYDFRLELGGVLVSWAVPKGPSFDPSDKRMAIHVEDHPLSYGDFEGTIPPKQYGAGTVIVWDKGRWEPVGDPQKGLAQGKLVFALHGQKLTGLWELVKMAKPGERQEAWLLFKKRDEFARPRAEYDVVTALPDSVITQPIKAGLPAKLAPQLATLVTGLPATGRWLFELKFDGYRLMTRVERGKARLITRGGHDWSDKMPELVKGIERLGIQSAWLDGEIVVLDDDGTPNFNALQSAFTHRTRTDQIIYFLFDLPFLNGQDLRPLPLEARRQQLKALIEAKGREPIRFSAAFEADPASILQSACQLKMEGVIAKRADAPYTSSRSETWLKLKCRQRQEFVVCGYTERSDGRAQIGSLLLGVHDEKGQLVSVGSVGTGWRAQEARDLKATLAKLHSAHAPFAAGVTKPGRWSKRVLGSERWVKPTLVAEVEFAEWTTDGQIRHASYIALRSDKPAKAIVREVAKTLGESAMRSTASTTIGKVKVSHGERVIDPASGTTKLALVRYYEWVADWILPHLKGRPCSLVRGPEGVGGELFFQKHGGAIGMPGVRELDPALWPDHDALLEVASVSALLSAAQMNVIEFHTWNSHSRHINKPDRMVFDLDPGEGTPWAHVQEAAMLVRAFLTELGLASWLKTSGGKGLHVVVPLTPRLKADTVKAFSKVIVQHLATTIPTRFVAKSGPANRVGKLFVDYLRNGHGATTAAAFSARARPGLGVSMPVAWDELPTLKSGAHWTVSTARDRLSFQAEDPWSGYWTHKQTLSGAMKALGFKPSPSGLT
ncbi:MAG: DNA ligase D [Aquabacterium sp.]|uniref:DNA ligase D n=1 Tax=Aquabacterium sp. TaxID=1872578 RepID=UPI0027186F00|nr:DNA ligase D [Aquabacterium sp.]MDO9002480.1 DNA ligase D [Aquabacterium sp.]